MICIECKKEIDNDSIYCIFCGTKQSSTYSSESDVIKTTIGTFHKLKNKNDDAFCLGCRKADKMNNLFYCKEKDEYYHFNCLKKLF